MSRQKKIIIGVVISLIWSIITGLIAIYFVAIPVLKQ